MRIHFYLIALAMWLPGAAPFVQGSRAPVPLFDGKSFNGWEGDRSMFRIEDGAIVGGSMHDKIPRNEFLCTTASYGDFELRLKVKLLGGSSANAGIQFRTRRIPNDNEVIGYQADVGQNFWGSLYDESRRKKTLKAPDADAIKSLVRTGDWNDYVVRAEGPRIRLWLNGVQTVDYTEHDRSIETNGVIAVQIHAGPPSEAWYKEITLLDLSRR
jgi:3-keto-disaccharide hydrolase